MRYTCGKNYLPFTDGEGCGCEFSFGAENVTPPSGSKLHAFDCSPEQRSAEACTAKYAPVCGWSDPAKIQCISYPCAQTYGNSCSACREESVGYYTLGECPAGNSSMLK